MRISEILGGPEPCFSFEFFPPKTEEGTEALFANVADLHRLDPGFVSVTYGAAGSTRDGTVEVTTRIQQEYGIEAMAHLSVVGETVEGVETILSRFAAAGIENVLALRGDPPQGEGSFSATPGGLSSSAELAAFIRGYGPTSGFGIGASCFPQIHPEAASPQADIAFLKEKVEAGAEFLVSQLFFDNEVYFEWLAAVRDAGIDVPVIPGILPIISREGLHRFSQGLRRPHPRAARPAARGARRGMPRRSGPSASPTPRASASSCSPPVLPGSTSSCSTGRFR